MGGQFSSKTTDREAKFLGDSPFEWEDSVDANFGAGEQSSLDKYQSNEMSVTWEPNL